MARLNVLVLVGSSTDEFHAQLSRVYARGFLSAMETQAEYLLRIAYVSPDGSWCFPVGLDADDLTAAPAMSSGAALSRVADLGVDVMVPQMFCRAGMTTYRAAFDLIGVRYVGNTPAVMAMAADKNISRAVVSSAGVPVPRGEVLRRGGAARIPLPAIVKPVDSDNSMGVTLVRDPSSMGAAVDEALKYSDRALVETYVELGREVRCGVIVRDGELVCLPLEEYAVDAASPIRGRRSKLDHDAGGDLYLVAKDSSRAWIVDVADPITEKVWAAARLCYEALGCRHYGLFDFRIDPDGDPWFLEAGLYCSYSPSSVVAVMASAAGTSVTDLFALTLNELSAERMIR